jgi:hypothetical protein
MPKCCEAFPTMLLDGFAKVGKILFIDFWVSPKPGNGIHNCIVYPFDVKNLWGIFF